MERSTRKLPVVDGDVQTLAVARHARKELARVALLKGAHQESIMRWLRECPVRSLERGDVLVSAGEICEALYLVLSGRLRMENPSGPDIDAQIAAGDSIGELFVLQDATSGSTIRAVESTRVLAIDRKTAWALINASHEVARNWLALLAERTRLGPAVGSVATLETVHRGVALEKVPGLHSRNWLESTLPRHMQRSSAAMASLGLLLVEIDGFDDYTRQHGITAGDDVCQAVAQTLVNSLRPNDFVAVYAIGQFAVVLPDCDGATGCLVGERVRAAVARAMASRDGGADGVTVSVGAAQCESGTDLPAFLAAAEAALEMAKRSGGNRVGMRSVSS